MNKPLVNMSPIVICFMFIGALAAVSFGAEDWRDFSTGHLIPDENYSDQPYLVKTKDGNWLCTLTTGKGNEGDLGQHVVATISSDMGKTWSPLIDIEPADGPEASWVVPLVTPDGRVYAFYDYNGDNVGHGDPNYAMPDGRAHYRADMLGWYCYKYSDDHGRTWSKRYRLPMPVAAVDRTNQWDGKIQIFWGIDKPKVTEDGAVVFAFTRLGAYMLENGEGWLYRSDNLLTESDPDKIEWKLYPKSGKGIRNEKFGSVQTEFNMVPTGDDSLYCVYRTTMGHPVHTYSFDGGRSWTTPEAMSYTPGGKIMRTPRACPKLWKASNGRYLFWFHNNGLKGFNHQIDLGSRNVAWLAAGRLVDGKMHWSQPEILCYCPHPLQGCSYPDLLEDDGRYFISSTQKSEARIIQVPVSFMNKLFAQHTASEVERDGLVLEVTPQQINENQKAYFHRESMPRLPNLADGKSFTIELWFKTHLNRQVLLTSVNDQGKGIIVRITTKETIRIDFGDGTSTFDWTCDPGMLEPGKLHHVVFVVDGGPKIVSVIVDGVLCNGGQSDERPYGWGHFRMSKAIRMNSSDHYYEHTPAHQLRAHEIEDVSGDDTLMIKRDAVRAVRIYNRHLMTSEAIGNYRAGLSPKK